MDANGREFILKDEVYAIISCSLEIIKNVGQGLNEKPSENSLAVEFRYPGIASEQQRSFPVVWRESKVGEFIPDLIGLPGPIINFKKPKLEWERINPFLLVSRKIHNDGWEGGEASLGSTRASRVVFGALAEDLRCRPFQAVFDEGVENHTRGRVCSPRF